MPTRKEREARGEKEYSGVWKKLDSNLNWQPVNEDGTFVNKNHKTKEEAKRDREQGKPKEKEEAQKKKKAVSKAYGDAMTKSKEMGGNLADWIKKRGEKGSADYNKYQNLINKAYGKGPTNRPETPEKKDAKEKATPSKSKEIKGDKPVTAGQRAEVERIRTEAKKAADKKAAKLDANIARAPVVNESTQSKAVKTSDTKSDPDLKSEFDKSTSSTDKTEDSPKKMTTVKRTKGSFPLREAKKAERRSGKIKRKEKRQTRIQEKLDELKNKKAKGGKIKAYENGGKVGDREPGQVFVDNGQFYQVNRKGTSSMKMTPGQVFSYLDENDALSAPHEGKTSAQSRSFAKRGITESLAKNDMDLMADYVKPGYRGIEGFAVRQAAIKGEGPTDYNPSKRSLRRNRN
jgi:hypothetical protein